MSLDDSAVDYSATDWREKYNEVADMLEQTRSELDEFHIASKELEAELESELQRTERAHKDLTVKVAQAEFERDEWKSKFMSLQTTHNTTSTSLQRELDQLRHDQQQLKVQFRDLEMGNDDLERTERAVSSNLADIENKYSRALEEKILLEQELIDKASLEEECQRLRDELRDASVEASILKDQLSAKQESMASLPDSDVALASQDDLLKTPPLGDLLLSELDPTSENTITSFQITPKAKRAVPTRLLASPSRITTPSTNGISRATTLPSSRPTPASRRPPVNGRNPSITSTSSTSSNTSGTTSKNKGVQMVSDMRARVKNLEQRIHTRVPRLRMGSLTGTASRANGNPATSTYSGTNGSVSSNKSATNKFAANKSSWDSFGNIRRSVDSKKSNGSDEHKAGHDSTGWVLIMEDSPSPQKPKLSEEAMKRERRRASSPTGGPFRPSASTAIRPSRTAISPTYRPTGLAKSTIGTGLPRPGSRLSGGSSISTATTSSIPTPNSRPTTPTFLPVPNSAALKRSVGGPLSIQAKRTSLGASMAALPSRSRERPATMPPLPPNNRHSLQNGKTSPLGIPSTVTLRSTNRMPKSGGSSLSKSRIGRPSGGSASRRGSMDEPSKPPPMPDFGAAMRPRSSSSATTSTDAEEIDETEMF